MCLARVYREAGGKPELRNLLLCDVIRIEFQDNGLLITDLVGESRFVGAGVRSVDFMEGSVLLNAVEGSMRPRPDAHPTRKAAIPEGLE